eukprot:1159303-Pelagomonas_calceolata.AAC.6
MDLPPSFSTLEALNTLVLDYNALQAVPEVGGWVRARERGFCQFSLDLLNALPLDPSLPTTSLNPLERGFDLLWQSSVMHLARAAQLNQQPGGSEGPGPGLQQYPGASPGIPRIMHRPPIA